MSNHSIHWLNYIAHDLWHELGDPEAEQYFWLKGPWRMLFATVVYLYLVLKAGPDFMRNRKPYDMKLVIRLYNLVLVAINAFLFYATVVNFRGGLDMWGCDEAFSTRKRGLVLYYGHLFFHTRYLEFVDTIFFVLRKKHQQINFLHVFHHGIVPPLMYYGLKFYPLPFNNLLAFTNTFVHIIMYAYYGLATFGPKMQPYLWWKKYLTTLQIAQFVAIIAHCAQPILFYNRPECKFPLAMIIVNLIGGITFFSLFVGFYKKSYGKHDKARRPQRAANDDSNLLKKQRDMDIWDQEGSNYSVESLSEKQKCL